MSFIELVAQQPPGMQPPAPRDPGTLRSWYRMEQCITNQQTEEEPDEEYDVFVYDAIGGWDGVAAETFVRDLKNVSAKRINLRINSPGGSVFDGITIANALRAHSARVTTYVDGIAASIASVIALAGDRIVMMPLSQLMIHDASGMCMGNPADMLKMSELLDKQSDNIAAAYAARGGGSVQMWRDLMRDETWYMAEEAVKAGIADEAMPVPPPDEGRPDTRQAVIPRNTWDLNVFRYAGREQAPDPLLKAESRTTPTATAEPATPASGDPVLVFNGYSSDLTAMLRNAIHAELTEILGAVSPKHSTAVEDGTWDAGANEKKLPSPVPVAAVKKMYTYWDADAAEDGGIPKSAAKLPHHFVSEDGTPGAASVNGVRNALARLPQTEGLSEAERSAAEAHLRAHLNAFKGGEEDHADTDLSAETEVQPDDSPAETPPADETPPTTEEEPPPQEEALTDEADDWTSVIGFLVSPTSSCADDVFDHVKEW